MIFNFLPVTLFESVILDWKTSMLVTVPCCLGWNWLDKFYISGSWWTPKGFRRSSVVLSISPLLLLETDEPCSWCTQSSRKTMPKVAAEVVKNRTQSHSRGCRNTTPKVMAKVAEKQRQSCGQVTEKLHQKSQPRSQENCNQSHGKTAPKVAAEVAKKLHPKSQKKPHLKSQPRLRKTCAKVAEKLHPNSKPRS